MKMEMEIEAKDITEITAITAKKSFYIYNTPGRYRFVPCRGGLYKVTVVGGGGGGYGGGGFIEEIFPYQSAGGGGGGTSIGFIELEADRSYKLTVGRGGRGGERSSVPGTMNCGGKGRKSRFDEFLTADGGCGGYHHTQLEYARISSRGGQSSGGDINYTGGDGNGGYYLTSEQKYSSVYKIKSGGDSSCGNGSRAHSYRQIRKAAMASRYTGNGDGVDGIDAKVYGTGGGGAGFYSFNKCGYAGGNGSCGIIIIEEAGA